MRARATGRARGEQLDRGQRAEQSRNRIGHRRTRQLRGIVARRPTAACLRRGPVAGAVVVDERADAHDREARELRAGDDVVETRVREHAGRMAVDEQVGLPEPRPQLVAVRLDAEVEAVPLLAVHELVVERERIGPAGVLEPDDARAEVGEHAPDERSGPRGAEHHHGRAARASAPATPGTRSAIAGLAAHLRPRAASTRRLRRRPHPPPAS